MQEFVLMVAKSDFPTTIPLQSGGIGRLFNIKAEYEWILKKC